MPRMAFSSVRVSLNVTFIGCNRPISKCGFHIGHLPDGFNHGRAFGQWGKIKGMWFELIDVLASRRYYLVMKANQKRATIYLDSELHRALRLKAAESDCSISALVNDAV